MHAPVTPPTLVLIGLRGSGKSTIGRIVADAAGLPFADLDDRTPALLDARDAADAINTQGLRAFRDAEFTALGSELEPSCSFQRVLALGGGTPTAPGAADLLMKERDDGRILIVYLHASPSVLRDRLRGTETASRPSLTGADMLDEIETVYLQRDALYRTLADHTLEAGEQDEKRTAQRILGLMGQRI